MNNPGDLRTERLGNLIKPCRLQIKRREERYNNSSNCIGFGVVIPYIILYTNFDIGMAFARGRMVTLK
jgi:hypothetical protein